jgi:5-methylcytosine-specific restriction enzyme A
MYKLCADCKRLTKNYRCDACAAIENARREQLRGSAAQRGYDAGWQRASKEQIERQPYCSVCLTTEDLTADHIKPKALGGTDDPDNLDTKCRSHNSEKGAR